jgi:uncharacterized protein (UPF0332 family)
MLENRIQLAKYRLESAKNCLLASDNLLKSNLYKDSINRSYYANWTTKSIQRLYHFSAKII